MKKFTPSIVIWNLELSDKEDETVYQNIYFLSYKRAKKFCDKHKEELEKCKIVLCGEQLWLW